MKPIFERKTVNLPADLSLRVHGVLDDLRQRGAAISYSGFLELAVRELLLTHSVTGTAPRGEHSPTCPGHAPLTALAGDYDIGLRRKERA